VFSAVSAAWVLPSIVGPALAGFAAQHVGWRAVFYGLTPFVAVGAALLAPALRGVGTGAGPGRVEPGGRRRVVTAARLAVGVAVLEVAGQQLRWTSPIVAAVGLVLLVPALRRLLPPGALRLRRGLPSVTVFRGILAGAFFGAEAFLPLDLQTVHRLSPGLAGLPLTLGAVGWFGGSWYQGHRPADRPRDPLIRLSFALVAAGVASLVAVTFVAVTPWLAVLSWAVAGGGMGIGMATVGVLVLQRSAEHEQGANSAALQISDAVGSTICIGVGGALLAAGRATDLGVGPTLRIVFALAAALAAIGFAVGGRARVA
jgi:predicted MFS family arabinose efflux permease